MEIRKITDEFSVSGQVEPRDLAVIAAMGFKSIICNRPDGEESFQPMFEAVEAEARNANLLAAYIPVAQNGPTASDVTQFAAAFGKLPKPVLAYCRTGGRSHATWTATQVGRAH